MKNECTEIRTTSIKSRPPPLQISTESLGLSFIASSNGSGSIDDDIFKQLNYPHMKKPFYSPSSESSSVASSPTDLPLTTLVSKVKTKTKAQELLSPAASFLAGFMTSPSHDNNNFIPLSTALPTTEEDTAIDEYIIGDTIGFGGFSIVHKAHHGTRRDDDVVAVKIINQYLMNDIEKLRLDRELEIWKSLSHPRIIGLKKVIHTTQKCYILCDYCSEGNLLTYLNNHKKLTEKAAKRVFKGICQGVYYLHIDRKVCHKDLKLENILLDHLHQVKICDFGLAIYQDYNKETEEAGGSLAYASPEQIKQEAPLTCPKTDIWSLGVILYALVVGSLPFMDTYDLRLQQKILEGKYHLPSDLSPALQSLIQGCLAYHPQHRLSVDQVLNSSWLKKGI
ncbi:unnamed protein product [Mucor hiemalis]